MQWGKGFCAWGHQLTPGGPRVLIYETPADLALQHGTTAKDDDGKPTCTNTMPLIEAEPGCGYTIDGEDESGGGRGPFEGKHIVVGDTLYHFGMAWNDSCPDCWGGSWCCGQVALWKAPIPEGAMPDAVGSRPMVSRHGAESVAEVSVWLTTGSAPSVLEPGRGEALYLFTPRGRKIGAVRPEEGARPPRLRHVRGLVLGKRVRD